MTLTRREREFMRKGIVETGRRLARVERRLVLAQGDLDRAADPLPRGAAHAILEEVLAAVRGAT
ncbi:MAG: hypothetical protein ACREB9_03495 [Thermoplasmata archaeon]